MPRIGGERKTPHVSTKEETPLEEVFEGKIEQNHSQTPLKKPKHEPETSENKFKNIQVSMPISLNKALAAFIAEQKLEDLKLYDKTTGTYKLVSKSSWIQYVVERELRKIGWDKTYNF